MWLFVYKVKETSMAQFVNFVSVSLHTCNYCKLQFITHSNTDIVLFHTLLTVSYMIK